MRKEGLLQLWGVSLGAGLVSCAIALVNHGLGTPWWNSGASASGWTIYPPLSAVGQDEADMVREFMANMLSFGLNMASQIAGGLTLLVWLLTLIFWIRQPLTGRMRLGKLLLPPMLLMPLAVSAVGSYVSQRLYERQMSRDPNIKVFPSGRAD